MRIDDLEWNDVRIAHIANHDVVPLEVWEVCKDQFHIARRQGPNRYRLYGQTVEGRYLFVVLQHLVGASYIPITARNMTDSERRNFRRIRK